MVIGVKLILADKAILAAPRMSLSGAPGVLRVPSGKIIRFSSDCNACTALSIISGVSLWIKLQAVIGGRVKGLLSSLPLTMQ